jgi:hypothetical protein
MKLSSRHSKAIGISLAAIAGTAAVAFLVLTALGVDVLDTSSASRGSGSELVEGPLKTANRDKLAICVASFGSDPSLEASAKSAVEAALNALDDDPAWIKSGLADGDSEVDIGCPSKPAAFQPGVKLIPTGNGDVFVDPFPLVAEASRYRIFVFLAPAETISAAFHDFQPTTTEEFLKSGDVFNGVTGGIYVSPEMLEKDSYLEQLIAASFAIDTLQQLQ